MASQSGSVASSVCLLLLVLLPLTLAQDECFLLSPDWPDCLPNRFGGTYYIRPEGFENTSCPAQPCITLTQLRDDFFACSDDLFVCDVFPISNISLFFLPGTHFLQLDYSYAIFDGDRHNFFSLAGYNEENHSGTGSPLATVFCTSFGDLIFSSFNDVIMKNLELYGCSIEVSLNDQLTMDFVILNHTPLILSSVDSVRITNSQMNTSTCEESALDISNTSFFGGSLKLRSCSLRVSGTSQFVRSRGSAIKARNSDFILAGVVSFVNNTAFQGGAIFLSDSRVTIADNAHVIFQGNHAEYVGGAIFSAGNDISNYVLFGERVDSCRILFGENSTVVFINNTADSYGSATYGIAVSPMVCSRRYIGVPLYDVKQLTIDQLYDILTIDPDDFSAVSSDPLRVCICSDQVTPDCLAILPNQNSTHYTVYPGQNFTIHAAAVGFNFAFTSAPVYTQFLNSDASLGSESQYVQGATHTGCSELHYSVLSVKKQETLVLTTVGRRVVEIPETVPAIQNGNILLRNPTRYFIDGKFVTNLTDGVFRLAGIVQESLQDTPVFISITLLDCPPGFTLSDQTQKCECDETILKYNLTCNINDQTVNRAGTIWINASFSGNSSNGMIVHQECPFRYCKQEPVDVNLRNPDTQCVLDHSGTLCGACKPNFSLILGSSRCLPNCSNSYLSLLIPFALAGFALVFFIKILNLTVSQGTVNGLIFYANIVAANRSIFFPEQYNKFLSFLSVFISWLNLDFGIETCFIEGLDGYWKTWLQFLFPYYVWAIGCAIILVSHYSTRATKMFGDNSVSLLATLFLLSYAKLIQSTILIFTFTTLVHPDNSTSAVWAFDGNIPYLGPKHIPLFLVAVAIVLLLWLPYTAVLLSAQWMRTKTYRKGLRWLKPFLDAYYGPFKDKHHCWVGVLLVVRGVLYIFFASFFAIENNVNLLLINIVCLSLPTYVSITGRQYKKIYLTILENAFFINLGVLAAGTLYNRLVGGNQEALVTICVGIAFIQFVGITAFHSYHFVIVPIIKRCSKDSQQKTELEFENDGLQVRSNNVVTHSEVGLFELQSEPAPLQESKAAEQYQLAELSQEHAAIPSEPQDDSTSNQLETKKPTDAEATGAVGAPSESKAAAVSSNEPPPTLKENTEPPRHLAKKESFTYETKFIVLREPLLGFTQQ